MKRKIALAVVFVAVFLAALVMTFPATHAWALASGGISGDAYGLRGTLWEGNAAAIIVEGHRLDRVRWKLQPGSIWRGQLHYQVQAELGDGQLRGYVRTGLDGKLRLDELRLDASADQLVRAASARPLPLRIGGHIDAYFQEVVLDRQGNPERIQGMVNWTNGHVVFGDEYELGDYAVRIDSNGDVTALDIITVEALLRVDGSATLQPDSGQLSGEVLFQALEGASPDLIQGLRFTGLPDPMAENLIRFNGNINNPMGFRGELQ